MTAKCVIIVRNNATGDTVKMVEDLKNHTVHFWTDGNFGCDCNRAHCFGWARDSDEGTDHPCGDSAFSIRIMDENGQVLHDELDGPTEATGQIDTTPWKPDHIVLPPSEAVAEAVVKFVSDPISNNQEFDKAARHAVQSAIVANDAIERMMRG